MKTKYSGLIIALFLLLVTAFTVEAFEVKTAPEYGPTAFLKWNTVSPVPITLNSAGTKNLSISIVQGELQKALAAWSTVPSQSLRLSYNGTSATAVADSDDNINSVVWVNSWPYGSSLIAVTKYTYYLQNPPAFADADILMNGHDYKWAVTSTNGNGAVDLQNVLIHELGHLIGLSHTSVYSANMYPYLSSSSKRILTPDEKAGAQFLYGSPSLSLSQVTPVANAVYVDGMASRGLPLPTFRWRGVPGSYTIEFSDTLSFGKKVRFSAGSANYYTIKSNQEKQLTNLSPLKVIFWRVTNGVSTTPARKMSFNVPL
jgi:hypothetical protein